MKYSNAEKITAYNEFKEFIDYDQSNDYGDFKEVLDKVLENPTKIYEVKPTFDAPHASSIFLSRTEPDDDCDFLEFDDTFCVGYLDIDLYVAIQPKLAYPRDFTKYTVSWKHDTEGAVTFKMSTWDEV